MNCCLQWSHGLAAVEAWIFAYSIAALCCLQWSHGLAAVETTRTYLRWFEAWQLQWSHGLGSRGSLAKLSLAPVAYCLQWSHGPAAVEASQSQGSPSMICILQWSHGLAAVETCTSACSLPPSSGSFNGATALQPWRQHPPVWTSETQFFQPQWSHGPAAVETAGPDVAEINGTSCDHLWTHPATAAVGVWTLALIEWTGWHGPRLVRAGVRGAPLTWVLACPQL